MRQEICIAAMTGDQADWDPASLSLGPFVLGRGSSAILAGIKPLRLADGTVVFNGEDALKVLSLYRWVILQHWPAEAVVDYLHRAGVKVGFWVNALSVQEAPMWNAVQHPLQQAMLTQGMKGTDGQKVVTWPGAVATDPRRQDFKDALCGSIGYILDTAYRTHRPDFFFVDELTDEWYCTADNAPSDAGWTRAVGQAIDALAGILPVWGHNTGFQYHTRSTVHEHATRGMTTAQLFLDHVDALIDMRPQSTAATTLIGLGWEKKEDVPASWCAAVRDSAWNAKVVFQGARTGKAFQLFDPFAEEAHDAE